MSSRLLAAAACAVVSLAAGCSSDDAPVAALDVELAGVGGASASLADFAGTALVVNLWATWCAPCVAEMPAFDAVAADLAAGGSEITVLGVNVGDSAEEAASFASELGVSYPILTDPDGRLSTALGVTGLPATAFIAADGGLVGIHSGAYTEPQLQAAIAEHFGDGAP
ncbi:MAG: TlpA family protein disulfide reductase [Ilumatobacteraceae bacterium]